MCHVQFGPLIRSNPLGEVNKLTQTSTVAAYQAKFLTLTSRTTEPLSENRLVSLFTAGLREDLAIDVELNRPEDLQEAMSLARAYERKAARTSSMTKTAGHTFFKGGAANTLAPATATPATDQSADTGHCQFRHLSPAELAEHRRQGLCYNCNEKFVRGHKYTR